MKKYLWLALMLLIFVSFTHDKDRTPVIYMIGDSTMANKPTEGDNPERGWGQMLSGYLSDGIRVDNHAVNGRSSKSFIDEGRWDAVLEKLRPGDYVFIQFGHNDEKPKADRHTDPGTTFDENLRKFVNESRARGAKPVLFNSIVRRNFGKTTGADQLAAAVSQDDAFYNNPDAARAVGTDEQGGAELVDTHGAYLESPRNVASELHVPFVDMNRITKELVEKMGPEESKRLFVWVKPNTIAAIPKGREDNTHLNVYGARLIAGLTIDAIAREVPPLAKYVRHYDYVVAQDGSGDFFTVQEAVNAVPDMRKKPTTIIISPWEYKEKIVIAPSKTNIH
ncbi:MAG: pectin esterase, partial [Muribaculaceae bacterium]|nr:pectin esterase [Muribaculaceae bacterium]